MKKQKILFIWIISIVCLIIVLIIRVTVNGQNIYFIQIKLGLFGAILSLWMNKFFRESQIKKIGLHGLILIATMLTFVMTVSRLQFLVVLPLWASIVLGIILGDRIMFLIRRI